MKNIVILGAGIGGLSAGWMLARQEKYKVTVIENSGQVGGICGTFSHEGFLLDYGPHKIYSVLPGILEEFKDLMDGELIEHVKNNRIYLFNDFLKYPFSMFDLARKMGATNMAECAMSLLAGKFTTMDSSNQPASYERYLVRRFGRKLYELVFEPLAEKTWGDPSTISEDIAKTRIPSSSLIEVALRATGLKKETQTTDAKTFYYPQKGFGRITERMAEEIKRHNGSVMLNAAPVGLVTNGTAITGIETLINGEKRLFSCDILISSIPLGSLLQLLPVIDQSESDKALAAFKQLQYRSAFLVYLFINQKQLTKDHWIFFPVKDVIFARVFEQKCLSPEMAPENETVLCCDFTDFAKGQLSALSDEELVMRCKSDLEKVGLIKKEWVTGSLVKRVPDFYPRYDLNYKDTLSSLFRFFKSYENLLLTGRVGFYNYNNADHCLDMGKFIAENIAKGKREKTVMEELEVRVADYRIVD